MKTKLFGTVLVALFLTVNTNANSYKNLFAAHETEGISVIDIAQEISFSAAEKFIPLYQKYLLDIEKIIKSTKLNYDVRVYKIEELKIDYTYKFSKILDSYQTTVVVNNIPFEYINARLVIK